VGNGKVIDGKCHPVDHCGSQTQRREPGRKEKMNEPASSFLTEHFDGRKGEATQIFISLDFSLITGG